MSPVSGGNFHESGGRALGHPPRRLLTASEAATYLGYSSTQVLRAIPVAPLRLARSGLGAGPRYDKVALDRWLDTLSGVASPPDLSSIGNEGDAAIEEWRLKHGQKSA